MFPRIVLATLATLLACSAATSTYSYDSAGRVTKIDYGSAGIVVYTYDKVGNLLTRQLQPAASTITTAAFVTQQYVDLLSREPDPGGFTYWTNQIDSGATTRAQVAASFFTSNEFSGSGLYVIKLYYAILKRAPDFGGWNYYFNILQTGGSSPTVLNSFLASTEFTSLYGSNLTNQAFVTLVYQNVLGRAPDSGGLSFYIGQLNAGTMTRAALMDQFVRSAEYDTDIRPAAYANLLYMGFLRRTADPTGLAFWTTSLANASALPGVVNGFITSAEYLARF